ncbi:MAG: hypothetical protein M3237_18990 [Actinomycetota bacterium]|nr:hypothetical protein [Actinomycetota bacterium]
MLARLRTPDHLAPTDIASTLAAAGVLALGAGLATPAAAEPSGDPAGHNGSIKIEYVGDADQTPENNPKQPCTLNVEWYGLDEGDIDSHVTFELKSPTPDAELSVDGPTEVAVGEDPAGGGNDLDAAATYTFAVEDEPGPQGHHLRVDVRTPGAKSLEYKTKVFWVESCAATPVESEAPTASTPGPPDATPSEPEPGPTASAAPHPQVMGTSLTQVAPAAPQPADAAPDPVTQAAPDAPRRIGHAPDIVDAGAEQTADRPEGRTPVLLPLFGGLLAAAGVLISVSRRHRGARRD